MANDVAETARLDARQEPSTDACHSHRGHGVRPSWWAPGVAGEWWVIENECFYYGHGVLVICRDGRFCTAYEATRRHAKNVVVDRLERQGWRSLFQGPRAARKQVLAYFGLEEKACEARREVVAAGCP